MFDTTTGKPLGQIQPPAATRPGATGKPDALQFAGSDKLLLSTDGTQVGVYDLKTGQAAADIPMEWNAWRGKPTVTPGGKYVVVPDTAEVRFYDAATGEQAGSVAVPKGDDGFGQPPSLAAVAVSPDGTRLAGLLEKFNTPRLVVWALADGAVKADQPLAATTNAFYAPKIAWSADSAGVLYAGEVVLDPDTGKPVFPVPGVAFGDRTIRAAASLGAVAYLDSANRNDRRVRMHALTAEKVAAAKEAVKSGGTAADASLPAIKPIDTAAAKAIDVKLATPKWTAALTPVRPVAMPVSVVQLAFPANGIESLRVIGGDAPVAVFESVQGGEAGFRPGRGAGAMPRPGAGFKPPPGFAPPPGFGPDQTTPRVVRRLDLGNGKVSGELQLPPGVQVAHVGTDGRTAVTVDTAEGRRVDVWTIGSDKPGVGFRPFGQDGNQTIAFAAAVGENRVAAVSSTGKIVAWTVPDGKAAYTAEVPNLLGPDLTPDGKYLYGVQSGRVRLFDAATGNPAGDLAPSFTPQADPTSTPTVAFRPDGKEAAIVLTKPGAGSRLVRWDVPTQKVIEEAPFNGAYFGGAKPAYVADGFLLFNDRDLYDIAHKAVVWSYPLTGRGRIAAQRPDGKVWYAAGGAFDSTAALVVADLPGPDVARKVSAVIDGPGVILKPGTAVKVVLNFTGSAVAANQAKTRELLQKSLADRGMKLVESGENLTVAVTVTERDTGEKDQFRRIGVVGFGGPQYDTVRVIELECQATVSAGGETLLNPKPDKLRSGEAMGMIRIPKEETNIEAYLHRLTWERVPGWVERTALPKYLAKTPDGVQVLPQSSPLTATGVGPAAK